MKTRRFLALFLVLVLALAALAGCNDTASNPSAPSDENSGSSGSGYRSEIVMGIDNDIATISPFGAMENGRGEVFQMIYEYLAQRTQFGAALEDMQLVCAKSIEKVDDATYNVELYDYIVDSAGNQITASDYKFAAETMLEKATYGKVNSYLDSIEVTGDYTFTIHMASTPLGGIEYLLSIIPVISQKSYEESPDEMVSKPITTAAYQVESFVNGSSLVLVKNENYWQTDDSLRYDWAGQNCDKINIKIITDTSQASIALQSRDVDMYEYITSDIIDSFYDYDAGAAVDGYTVHMEAANQVNALLPNCSDDSACSDVRVRQAIFHAIDRQEVTNYVLDGYGDVLNAVALSMSSDYIEEWDTRDYFSYDPDLSRQLLTDAGYAGGLTLKMIATNNTTGNRLMQVLQAQLDKVGITLEIQAVESAVLTATIAEGDWDLQLAAHGCDDFVTDNWSKMFNQGSFSWEGTKNFIVDEKLQELFVAASGVSTHSEESVAAFEQYLTDNAYALGLFAPYKFYVANSDVVTEIVTKQGEGGGAIIVGNCVLK